MQKKRKDDEKRMSFIADGSRKRPKRSSEKLYARFHLSTKELSGPAMIPPSLDEDDSTSHKDKEINLCSTEFETAGISSRLAAACVRIGLKSPTSVQREAFATLKKKKSALIVAPTGSGKTLAYALPMLDSLKGRSRDQGLGAVIIAPTRELCVQICQAITRVGRFFDVGIVAGAITGGERRKSEKARLRKGLVILCATPGRLLDHLKSTEVLVRAHLQLSWFILDEVDRLLDLGLGPQVDQIATKLLSHRPKQLHSIVVTATLDARVVQLASKHLGESDKYARIVVSSSSHILKNKLDHFLPILPSELRLEYCVITLKLRLPALAASLRRRNELKTLVFTSTCAAAELHYGLASSLLGSGDNRLAERLHGGMDHIERKQAYESFCTGKANILFATDIAARGLDFARARVDWVLHLDPPREISAFVHRSGRAARAGRTGITTVFLLPSERRGFLDALSARGISQINRVGLPHLSTFHADADRIADEFQLKMQNTVQNNAELLARARDAFAAHLRAYASKPDARLLTNDAEREALALAFNLRKLHLGHAAKAFALIEAPRTIASKQREAANSIKKKKGIKRQAKYETTHFTTRVGPDGAKLRKTPYGDVVDVHKRSKKNLNVSSVAKQRRRLRGDKPLHTRSRSIDPPSYVSEFGA
mmetsp:Transcript_4764/g.7178  ORF Transcript_4764/g.7178 Transcript_4764/m.7178 type:complete len:655 (+) Transcript_4764:163-2127(+)